MDEMQSYLFREGNCAYAHQFMGAHPCKGGYDFAVWAPDARAVSVVGDFNDWDHLKNPMENHDGIWTARIPGVKQYATYKYAICGPTGWQMKADPYAFHAQDRQQDLQPQKIPLEGQKVDDGARVVQSLSKPGQHL